MKVCEGCGEPVEVTHPYKCVLLARAKEARARAFSSDGTLRSQQAARSATYLKHRAEEETQTPLVQAVRWRAKQRQ